MQSILRARQVYGRGNPIPVGHSKFYADYVLHDENDPFVPHTDNKVRRLKAVPLGERANGFLSGKIEELVEGLSRLSVAPTPLKSPIKQKKESSRQAGDLETLKEKVRSA